MATGYKHKTHLSKGKLLKTVFFLIFLYLKRIILKVCDLDSSWKMSLCRIGYVEIFNVLLFARSPEAYTTLGILRTHFQLDTEMKAAKVDIIFF